MFVLVVGLWTRCFVSFCLVVWYLLAGVAFCDVGCGMGFWVLCFRFTCVCGCDGFGFVCFILVLVLSSVSCLGVSTLDLYVFGLLMYLLFDVFMVFFVFCGFVVLNALWLGAVVSFCVLV